MAHCIHSIFGHNGVDKKDKRLFLYAVFMLVLIGKLFGEGAYHIPKQAQQAR